MMNDYKKYLDDPYAIDLVLEIKTRLNELVEQKELLDADYDSCDLDEDFYMSEKEYLDTGIKALQLELLELAGESKKECR